MRLHLLKLPRLIPPLKAENLIVYGNLPEVVHRRRLNQVLNHVIGQVQNVIPADFLSQHPHYLARTPDMAAGRVVAAFHHRRHAEDEAVVHLRNVFCLLLDLLGQFLIEVVQQMDVLLALRVIRDEELIASFMDSVA